MFSNWHVYLQKEKNSEVDEGDNDDRDQELEETGEYCVPATQHLEFLQIQFTIGSNTFCNLDKCIWLFGQMYLVDEGDNDWIRNWKLNIIVFLQLNI